MRLRFTVAIGEPFPLRRRIGARIIDFGLRVAGLRYTVEIVEGDGE